jgi:hypothetical protein
VSKNFALGMLAAFVTKVVAFDVQDATMRADNLSVFGKAVEECDRLYPLTTYRNGPLIIHERVPRDVYSMRG